MSDNQEELRLMLKHESHELDGESFTEKLAKQQEQESAEQAEHAEQELTVPLTLMISGAAAVLAPNWQITTEEAGQLAEVYAPVINKYFPSAANYTGGVEMNAAMVTLGIVGARVMAGTPRKLESKAKQDESASESALNGEREVLEAVE